MQKQRIKLLVSKIQIPDIQRDFERREDLLEELEQVRARLLIFHATIGYGKTVLMSQYARLPGRVCAWYHLDSLDNEVSTFLRYLISSLNQALEPAGFFFEIDPYLGEERGQVTPFGIMRELSVELAEYLSGRPEERLALVLDDFQVLENEEIFELLRGFLEDTPENLTLLIATKSSVPGLFTRYLVKNEGKLLGSDRLSFSEEETWDVLARLLSREAADSYTEMVWKNTEGWAAGVMFAVLYLRQLGGKAAWVDWTHISQESLVQNYITYELFKGLPHDLQRFLLRTSFAEELSPELCNFLCGISNSGGILKYLLQEDMFIIRVGGKCGSYRYHSMFRSFLNDRAGEELGREMGGQLALYYMKRQEMSVAVGYALGARETGLLEAILEKSGAAMLHEGKGSLVKACLEALRKDGESFSPELEEMERRCDAGEEDRRESEPDDCRETDPGNGRGAGVETSWGTEPENSRKPEPGNSQESAPGEAGGGAILRVSCFGRLRVCLPSGREITWRTRKSMELFACLLEMDGRPVNRRTLLGHLWPDSSPENAVAMLHNMIYSIRRELSREPSLENLIRYRDRQYSLDMSLVDCDLKRVEELCVLAERGRAEELLARKDELLPYWGVYLEDVDGSWCMGRRAYFERSYGKICRIVASFCEETGDFETEAAFWRACLEADRYCEDAVSGLLRSYGKMGERTQMKKFYEAEQKIFREELSLELGDEVRQAYESGIGKKQSSV